VQLPEVAEQAAAYSFAIPSAAIPCYSADVPQLLWQMKRSKSIHALQLQIPTDLCFYRTKTRNDKRGHNDPERDQKFGFELRKL